MKNGLEIDRFGNKYWYKNGKLHRDDGPAMELVNGDKEWYKDGKCHRNNGPAVEEDGDKFWYKNDELHRDDGPAIELSNGGKFWYKNGKSHRNDGPAVEYLEGNKEYWYNGKQFNCKTTEEFLRLIKLEMF
jgi:hypothetical protein